MAKEEPIQLEGQVTEVLPNATFRVQLTNGHNVLATLGGNMRRFRIRVLQGDRVTIEVSPNRFMHSQLGGSAWRWNNTATLELAPLRLRSIAWWTGSTISPVADTSLQRNSIATSCPATDYRLAGIRELYQARERALPGAFLQTMPTPVGTVRTIGGPTAAAPGRASRTHASRDTGARRRTG